MTTPRKRTRKPPAPKPPTRRVNRGNGHSYFVDGEKARGVTTIIGDGVPKPALINWAAETTAGYAIDYWDELADLKPSERLKRLNRARWDTQTAAAVRGTDVHKIAERLSRGEEDVEVPEHLVGHVDSLLAWLDAWEVEELLPPELVVIGRKRWGVYAGTVDLYARLKDGKRWLLDYKTGAKGIFPDTAVQLAAYADADTWLDTTVDPFVEHPMPEVDRIGAVWIRADGADLIPVDVCPEDELHPRLVFAYAAQVARFATAERGTYLGDAIQPPSH